jgi:hypothetical protein
MRYARTWGLLTVTSITLWLAASLLGQSDDQRKGQRAAHGPRMSAMGMAAANARSRIAVGREPIESLREDCVNAPRCSAGFRDDPAGTQSELSIAVDATGRHVVVGFNDFRGFSKNPLSVSGFMYSDDGGRTFVDGGQLPTPGNESIGSTRLPMVYGDPEVEYLGACTFVYSSILVKKFSATTAVQTMGIHRSFDCGHTWEGPFEVTAATNPNGRVDGSGNPTDAADKEFMSADPETGRVVMSWTNFTPEFAEIATAYSDDILAPVPTWSRRVVVAATDLDGQGSNPAFAAGSGNAYVVWARYPFPGTFFGYGNMIGFARSTDNGETWSAPVDLSPEFVTMDHVLGNDRVHTFPAIAVDNSGGPYAGSIYVAYVNNDSRDGSDIVIQRSTDEGATFSSPLVLNSRPGEDRSQWFPWVTVDRSTGRVHVFYFDQGIATSGDLTEVSHTYSDDGGTHWVAPLPLSRRPFNAGWGNDTSQPNLGDYNQAVAQDGELFAAFAATARPPLGFVDGQPAIQMTVPDIVAGRYTPARKPLTVDLQAVTFSDSGDNGSLDPGETAVFRFTIRNYVTNPLHAAALPRVSARLSTTTPGVVVTRDRSRYDPIAPGQTGINQSDLVVTLLPGFVAGTPIEFSLELSAGGFDPSTLLHTQFSGTPESTVLLSENFDDGSAGLLPAGWETVHGAGTVEVRWTTRAFCGTSKGAFHANDDVGGPANRSRWERLFSPVFVVPVDAEYLDLEFDVCYDTEEDPNFNVLAYDGFFLRVTDLTPGRTLRSVLAEAFADAFTTGSLRHYPRHLPRNDDVNYFEDMSAWAGFSGGLQHVRMRLPGVAGSTMQLRFEYTQDALFTCEYLRGRGRACGVLLDNVVVKSVRSRRHAE